MSKKKDEIKSAQVSLCVYISFDSAAVHKSESELPVLKAAHKSDLFQFIHVIGSPGVIISAQADVRCLQSKANDILTSSGEITAENCNHGAI